MDDIETMQAWQELIDRVELRHPPFPMTLSLEEDDHHRTPQLLVNVRVLDRARGTPLDIVHIKPLSPYPSSEELYHRIREVFDHELAETFHVDGERVHDPHRDEGSR